MAIFAQTQTVTVIEPTVTPTVTPSRVPEPVPNINVLFSFPNLVMNQTFITTVISPVASTVDTSGVSVTNTPPDVPTNMLGPGFTLAKPLQQQPQTFGSGTTMTSDGTQLLSSMQNGEVAFSQFQSDPENNTYKFQTTAYVTQQSGVSNSNRIVSLEQQVPVLNPAASAVGCVGVKSIVLSNDDLRIYVAYRDSTVNSNNPFAFEQTIGKVQVWSRSPGPSGSNVNASDLWQHVLDLKSDMANPFGSQIIGIPVQGSPLGYNSFTETTVTGDEFGSYMAATSGVVSSTIYAIGISSQTGITSSIGRCISMFEEQSSLEYACTGVLFLPTTGNFASSFTINDRSSFGTSFALVGDTCVASLGAHNAPASRRLANFRYEDHAWKFVDIIPSPTPHEFFGTSIAMAYYGGVMIVGSPASSAVGDLSPRGGHVYLFTRSALGVWSLNASVEDPFLGAAFPNLFTFGWFVNVSRDFRYMTVSANQDSAYRATAYPLVRPVPNTCQSSAGLPTTVCSYTCIEVFGIDQVNNVIDTTHVSRVFQDSVPDQFIDPLFGSNVSMGTGTGTVLFLTGSPLNQTSTLFQMAI